MVFDRETDAGAKLREYMEGELARGRFASIADVPKKVDTE